MKKVIKIVSIVLLSVLGVVLIGYAALAIVFYQDTKYEYKEQKERLEKLLDDRYLPVDEVSFANFDIYNNELRLNEIQVLATHNSYKRMPFMPFSKFLQFCGGQRVRNGHYGLPTLTEQLNRGIRGVEIDVVIYKKELRVIHDPIADWRTNGPDFKRTLQEIKLWSDINPNHIPINIMLQVRNSFCPYDHKIGKFKKEDIKMLDDTLGEIFGDDKIIKPADVKGEYPSLREAIEQNGWPKLSDCLGKVYFSLLIDDKPNEEYYIDIDPSFEKQRGFIFTRPDDEKKSYTAIILADSPFTDGLQELINQNYILRTRIDEQFDYTKERYDAAMTLGSQILATDHLEGNLLHKDYAVKLTSDNKTIIKRAI